jgi:hypothetical protein
METTMIRIASLAAAVLTVSLFILPVLSQASRIVA